MELFKLLLLRCKMRLNNNPLAQSIWFFQEFEDLKVGRIKYYSKSRNKKFEKLNIYEKFWKISYFKT